MNRTTMMNTLSKMDRLLLSLDDAMPAQPTNRTVKQVKPIIFELTNEYERLHSTLTGTAPLTQHNGEYRK